MADRAFGRNGILNADSFTAVLNPRECLAAKQAMEQGRVNPEMVQGAIDYVPEVSLQNKVLSPQEWLVRQPQAADQPILSPAEWLAQNQPRDSRDWLAQSRGNGSGLARFAEDAAEAVADYVKGAAAGLQEVNREQAALDRLVDYEQPYMPAPKERLDLAYTPREGYSQNDADFQKAKLDKAKAAFYHETVLPTAMLAGGAAASFTGGLSAAIPLAAGMGKQAVDTYRNTNGTALQKLGNAARAITYGPLVDELTDPGLGQKFDKNPARTAANLTLAARQALLPVAGARAGVKAVNRVFRPEVKKAAVEPTRLDRQWQEAVEKQDLSALSKIADAYEQQGNRLTARGIRKYVSQQRSGTAAMLGQNNTKSFPLQEKVNTFVDNAIAKPGKFETLPVREVLPEEAATIRGLTNINVDGFKHDISTNGLRYALKEHRNAVKEAKRGQLPITADDLKKIPDILDSYDSIKRGSGSGNSKSIIYQKRVNGSIYYVETVIHKKGVLRTKTMWKKSSAQIVPDKSSPPYTSESSGSRPTAPERSLTASTTNISPTDRRVKGRQRRRQGSGGRNRPIVEEPG